MLTPRPESVSPVQRWTRGPLAGGWRAPYGDTASVRRPVRLSSPHALVAGLVLGCTPALAAQSGVLRVERAQLLMGTELRVVILAPSREHGGQAIEAAFQAVRRADDLLSTWRDDSEVARLNRAPPGVAVSLAPELLAVLREVRAWSGATEGAFDPAIGALVDAWDLRGAGRRAGPGELAEGLAASGLDRFELPDSGRAARRRHRLAWIDTGAFGKGAALRAAGAALRQRGIETALLNFGGQVLALGAPHRAEGWKITVAHPSDRDRPVATLVLHDRSAATTGQSERFVTVDGMRLGHVLDPRTGLPVPAWGSVTVVAADPLVADILSTALFVLGPDVGMEWLTGRDDVAALFLVERDGAVVPRGNAALEAYLADAGHHGVRSLMHR